MPGNHDKDPAYNDRIVLADLKACAKGAKVIAQTDMQFDSTGGDRQDTPMSAVTAWAEKLK